LEVNLKTLTTIAAILASTMLGQTALAASAFQDHVDHCLDKFANTRDSASVMLQCSAGDGKLSDCKVVENSAPGRGFDKAALCVAEKLPMGAKTGDIKVPVRFAGS
jgi:hypothetical protein